MTAQANWRLPYPAQGSCVSAMRIAENAGHDGHGILAALAELRNPHHGFDAHNGCYGDLLQTGVVDPARVTVAALEAANSVAALFLTTETVVSNPPPPPFHQS